MGWKKLKRWVKDKLHIPPSPIPIPDIPIPVNIPGNATKPGGGGGPAPMVPSPEGGPPPAPQPVKRLAKRMARSLEKIGNDTLNGIGSVEVAGTAILKFLEKEAKTPGASLKQNEKRLREGKIVDAFWHFTTDRLAGTEDHAAEMALESALVRNAMSMAATYYGGPWAAAAFAAWLKYKETDGDVEAAFLAGAVAGWKAAAAQGLDKAMPAGDDILVQKAIVAGFIGGVATAAGGGDEDDIVSSFLWGAGGILVIDGYQLETERPLLDDIKRAVFEPFVMNGVERSTPGPAPAEGKPANSEVPAVPKARTPLQRESVEAKEGVWLIAWDSTKTTTDLPSVVLIYNGKEPLF